MKKTAEGETIQNYNPEKGWNRYKKSKIKVKEYNLIPKGQLDEEKETLISKKRRMKIQDIQKRIERALKAEYSDKEVAEYIDSFDIVMEIRKKAYEEGRNDQAELDKMLYGTVINPNLEKEIAESKLLKD